MEGHCQPCIKPTSGSRSSIPKHAAKSRPNKWWILQELYNYCLMSQKVSDKDKKPSLPWNTLRLRHCHCCSPVTDLCSLVLARWHCSELTASVMDCIPRFPNNLPSHSRLAGTLQQRMSTRLSHNYCLMTVKPVTSELWVTNISRVLCPSLLSSHKSGRCAVNSTATMHLILAPSILHLSHGFQCSPTLNHQPYEGRLPLTSWWRKSSNMTVGQSSLISSTHHFCDWIQEPAVAGLATSWHQKSMEA